MADTKNPTSGAAKAPPSAKKKAVGPFTFISQVRSEARKVTWTTRQETVAATIMVLIMVVLAAIFFLGVDFVVSTLVRFVTGVGPAS
ncbi:preprotein translocase subunit SecE [bacterium]|nr:preprotein translocase subunit SecE [bacterium]